MLGNASESVGEPGLRTNIVHLGRDHGFLASWRPFYSRTGTVKVTGSPFDSFTEVEDACNAMLGTFEERELTRRGARALRTLSGDR
jgi:hypothetical protein